MYIVHRILHNYTIFIYTIKLTYDRKIKKKKWGSWLYPCRLALFLVCCSAVAQCWYYFICFKHIFTIFLSKVFVRVGNGFSAAFFSIIVYYLHGSVTAVVKVGGSLEWKSDSVVNVYSSTWDRLWEQSKFMSFSSAVYGNNARTNKAKGTIK